MSKSIVVVGATPRRAKFANKCVRAYQQAGWTVYPVNPQYEEVEGLPCYAQVSQAPGPVDRVSMYVGPKLGKEMLEDLRQLAHGQLWFNPGAADAELIERARELGLNPVQGCSIVDIGMSPAMFPDT